MDRHALLSALPFLWPADDDDVDDHDSDPPPNVVVANVASASRTGASVPPAAALDSAARRPGWCRLTPQDCLVSIAPPPFVDRVADTAACVGVGRGSVAPFPAGCGFRARPRRARVPDGTLPARGTAPVAHHHSPVPAEDHTAHGDDDDDDNYDDDDGIETGLDLIVRETTPAVVVVRIGPRAGHRGRRRTTRPSYRLDPSRIAEFWVEPPYVVDLDRVTGLYTRTSLTTNDDDDDANPSSSNPPRDPHLDVTAPSDTVPCLVLPWVTGSWWLYSAASWARASTTAAGMVPSALPPGHGRDDELRHVFRHARDELVRRFPTVTGPPAPPPVGRATTTMRPRDAAPSSSAVPFHGIRQSALIGPTDSYSTTTSPSTATASNNIVDPTKDDVSGVHDVPSDHGRSSAAIGKVGPMGAHDGSALSTVGTTPREGSFATTAEERWWHRRVVKDDRAQSGLDTLRTILSLPLHMTTADEIAATTRHGDGRAETTRPSGMGTHRDGDPSTGLLQETLSDLLGPMLNTIADDICASYGDQRRFSGDINDPFQSALQQSQDDLMNQVKTLFPNPADRSRHGLLGAHRGIKRRRSVRGGMLRHPLPSGHPVHSPLSVGSPLAAAATTTPVPRVAVSSGMGDAQSNAGEGNRSGPELSPKESLECLIQRHQMLIRQRHRLLILPNRES